MANDFDKQVLKVGETRVWRTYMGGWKLNRWRGRAESGNSHYPEDWVASTVQAINPGQENPDEGLSHVLLDGKPGPLLRDLIASAPSYYLGQSHKKAFGAQMGVLIKLIDAAERLAIQVHPDKAYAKNILGSNYGKTEAWYILGDETGGNIQPCIHMGFKPGVTRQVWEDIFHRQDIPAMIDCLHKIPVSPGDVFFIEGGVPHAIGEGCFLAEIQEPTDYTMRTERFTVSGTPIPDALCHQGVGFDKMLDCFHYEPLPLTQALGRWKIPPRTITYGDWGRMESLVDERCTSLFSMRRIKLSAQYCFEREPVFSVAIVLSGEGTLSSSGSVLPVSKGDFLFIPAGISHLGLDASGDGLELLECFPPKP